MNKLIKFFINQPLFVNLLCVFIVIAGTIALKTMIREMFPNVNYDIVMVSTTYQGASPRDIEKLITIPLEKELKEVDDVEELTSASIENFSLIHIKIDPDADDPNQVVTDIQRAVDKAKDLPKDLLDDPIVKELETKDVPVIEISLASDMSEFDLQNHAQTLEDQLLDIPEVSSITRKGWRNKEIWVEVSPEKSSMYHIALSEIMRIMGQRNISTPGGTITRSEKEYLLRTSGEFETVEEVKKVIIRANDAGNWVHVDDIAKVSNNFDEEQNINKTNGKRAISLVVIKKQSADAIDLVDKIKDLTDNYKRVVPNSPEISLVNDFSYYIKRRLKVLVQNGFLGIIFVVIILLLFLNPRVAGVTAVGIPIAFMLTFFTMFGMGMSINLISMFGLIIVLGMLVDDAIVIAENVFRHIELGKPFKEAAVVGTLEVWRPVLSTVLTTIAAFTPLMFMTGIMGKFIWSIPVVVIIALFASILEAFFVLPSHLAEMGRIPDSKLIEKFKFEKPKKLLKKITKWYVGILSKAISRRYLVSLGAVLLLIGTLVVAKYFVPVVLFPAKGIEVFFIRARMPVGTPLQSTEKQFKKIEELVSKIPDTEMNDYVSFIGMIQEDPHDPFTQRASHVGQIAVYLKPEVDRDRNTKEIIEELRENSKNNLGFEELSFDEVHGGPPVGKPVAVRIRGDNLEKLDRVAEEIKTHLATINGVTDIRDDYELGKSELRVVVNEAKAMTAGLTTRDIANAVRFAYDGGVATTIKKADEEIDVRVRFPYDVKYNRDGLSKVTILNPYGDLVPLTNVASFIEKPGVSAIKHRERRRTVNVTANVDQGTITSVDVTKMLEDKYSDFMDKNPGYTISFGGEYEETSKSMDSLYKAFLLAVLLIFLILATNFNALIQPIIVMMAIPFGIIGVIIAFMIHGEPLSFLSLIGTVGLAGVVVNSSIILMDFINKRRAEGADRRTAILDAGTMRIRPVIITVSTTVMGLFPVAYGLWGSDPMLKPAALALMWGLIFSTALTLIVIPCFYAIADDLRQKLSFCKFWTNGNGLK